MSRGGGNTCVSLNSPAAARSWGVKPYRPHISGTGLSMNAGGTDFGNSHDPAQRHRRLPRPPSIPLRTPPARVARAPRGYVLHPARPVPLSAVTWVGCTAATWVLLSPLLRAGDHVRMRRFAGELGWVTRSVLTPAAIMVLICGVSEMPGRECCGCAPSPEWDSRS